MHTTLCSTVRKWCFRLDSNTCVFEVLFVCFEEMSPCPGSPSPTSHHSFSQIVASDNINNLSISALSQPTFHSDVLRHNGSYLHRAFPLLFFGWVSLGKEWVLNGGQTRIQVDQFSHSVTWYEISSAKSFALEGCCILCIKLCTIEFVCMHGHPFSVHFWDCCLPTYFALLAWKLLYFEWINCMLFSFTCLSVQMKCIEWST